MQNLKKKLVQRTYLQNRKRFMDLENKHMITKGERFAEVNLEFGIKRYTVLSIKSVNNKDRL